MYLEELVDTILLEDIEVEYKSRLNREDVLGWLKTIGGFSNAQGGRFYIGVEDKTNKLIGFDRKEADNERNYFNNMVNDHIVPRPQMSISFLSYKIKEKERFVICIKVAESKIKPVICKYKGIPSIFMRRDGFTNGASYEEIIEMSIKSKNTQYDIQFSETQYDPEDFKVLHSFYARNNSGKELPEKALRSMGFFDEQGHLANGAILFSYSYHGEKTAVQCSMFSGFSKGSDRIVTVNRFYGNVIDSIHFILEFVEQRMNHSMIKKEGYRKNIDSFPARALFEAIINAVAHRDYYLDGTQIQVDLFKDRLEISSPGSFFQGEQLSKTYDLSSIISKRRNELIAAVLVMCNVMEAAGTGFDKIVLEYRDVNKKHRPYIFSSSNHFTIVLPDLTYLDGVENGSTPRLSFIPVENGTKYDQKVLEFCYYRAHKISEIAEYLGVSDSTYFRKNVIENLEKQNYLHSSKLGRAKYFRTNQEMVRIE